MEEVLVVVLQGLLEFGVEFAIYMGFDLATDRDERSGRTGCILMFFFLVGGGILGALANLVHPKAMLPFAWMRITNLIVGPFAAAGLSWLVANLRERKHHDPRLHFWLAFVFVLGFDIVRFAYAK